MYFNVLWTVIVLVVLVFKECQPQEEDEGPYKGKLIGKLKSYHHQVSGEVYAVNETTLLLVDFNYDGTGDDAFFWAGDTIRTGPQGFIVPDEHGKTNVLERYINAEVLLTLPEGRQLSKLKWFSVYDIGSQNVFGDVDVPEGWEAPSERSLPALLQDSNVSVSSGPVVLLDDNTILIKDFKYQGHEESYFWAGTGPQPSARGFKIPDERGYLEPLRAYNGVDVRLRLGGGRSLRALGWVSVWDAAGGRSLASLRLPAPLHVPPARARAHPHRAALPNCRQLHRDLQLSWEVFGNAITIQLAGKIGSSEYMAFGASGSTTSSRMAAADVVLAHYNSTEQRGHAHDYNITDIAPCVQVLGAWRGVCRDAVLGGAESAQLLAASRADGVSSVTYRRSLQPDEPMDRALDVERQFVVWAVGPLDYRGEPAYHRLAQNGDLALRLTPAEPFDDCFPFSTGPEPTVTPWDTVELSDPGTRVFDFRLGPAGGARGARGRGLAPPPLVWYVRGWLMPTLQLRRGLTYTFEVYGGKDPHSASLYHPLMVTSSRRPDTDQLTDHSVPLVGLRPNRRGRFTAEAAGDVCAGAAAPGSVPEDFPTFRLYNRSLTWRCAGARPYRLTLTPDQHWPDTVYYHSFTVQQDMGGKINIVDKYRKGSAKSSVGVQQPKFDAMFAAIIVTKFAAMLAAP